MATDANAGTLSVAITGDISNLLDSLTKAQEAASTAGNAIAESFSASTTGTDSLDTSLEQLKTCAEDAGTSLEGAATQAQHSGEAAHEAESGWSGLSEQLIQIAETVGIGVGIEELGREAFSAASQVQDLTTSLTFMSGSSEKASEEVDLLKSMAINLSVPFEQAAASAQKMTAQLGSFDKALPLMQAAADASHVMGTSFESATNTMDRMVLSGTVMARALVQLGLSTHDLAEAMGVADAAVKGTFASLDQSGRIAVLIDALGKYAGASAQFAQNLGEEWTNFKTQFEFDLEAIGNALTPLATEILSGLGSALADIQPSLERMAELVGGALTDNVKSAASAFSDLKAAVSADLAEPIEALYRALTNITGIDVSKFASITQFFKDSVGYLTGLNNVAATLSVMAAALDLVSGKLPQDSTAMKDAAAAVQAFLAAHRALPPALAATGTGVTELSASLQKLIDTHQKASEKVQQLKADVAEAAAALKAGKISQDDYNAVLQDYDKALKSLNTSVGNTTKANQEFVQSTKNAKDGAAEVADALKQIASGFGTLTPLQVAWNAAQEHNLATMSPIKSAYDQWSQDLDQLGKGKLPQVITSYDNFNDALNKLGQGFNQSYAQEVEQMHGLAGMVNGVQMLSGNVGDATGKINSLGLAIADVGKVVIEASGKVTNLAGAVADANEKWDAHASKVETNAQKLQDVAAAALAAGDSINEMAKDVENAAEQFLALQGAASASIDSVNSATSDMGGTGGKGKKAAGVAGGAESILGMYAAEGVLGETLDHLAQAMGLVVTGFNQYMTPAAYDAAYGLNAVKAASASAATDLVNLEALGMSTKDAQAEMTKLEQEANATGRSLASLVTEFENAHNATTKTTAAITGLGTAVSGSTGTTPVMIALAGAAGTAASNLVSASNAAGGLATADNTATASAVDLAGNFGKMSAAVVDTTSALGGLVASAADLAGNFGKMAAGMLGPIDTTDTALENLAKQSNATAEAFLKLNGGLGSIGASGGNLFAGNNPGSAPWTPPSTVPWSSFGFGPSSTMGSSNIQINVTSPTHQTIASQIVQALRNNAGLKL